MHVPEPVDEPFDRSERAAPLRRGKARGGRRRHGRRDRAAVRPPRRPRRRRPARSLRRPARGPDDPEVADEPRRGARGRHPRRPPRRRGATPRSRASGSAGRSARPSSTPARQRPPSRRPAEADAIERTSTSRPRRSCSPRAATSRCSSRTARRARRSRAQQGRFLSGCWARSSRSARRWLVLALHASAAGSARMTARMTPRRRRLFAVGRSSPSSSRSSSSATYNAVVALRHRIDKAWANIDVALKQRHDQLPNLVAAVRGADGLRAGRPDRGHARPGRLLPGGADPRPGRDVARQTTRGGPVRCSRSSSAYPELKSAAQRARPPGGDRAPRGRHRRPARALQRPGLPLQHADRAGPDERSSRRCSAGSREPFFAARRDRARRARRSTSASGPDRRHRRVTDRA